MYGKQAKNGKFDESCYDFRKSEAQGVENGVAYKKIVYV